MLGAAVATTATGEVVHGLHPYCDWSILLVSRTLIGFVVALVLARIAGAPIAVRLPPLLWARSLCGAFAIPCTFYAYAHIPTAEALVLTNTAPIWIVASSAIFLGQWPRPVVWIAIAAGIAGIVVLQRPAFEVGNLGAAVAVASALLYSISIQAVSRLRHTTHPLTILVHLTGASVILSLALCVVTAREQLVAFSPTPAIAGGLVLVALFATAGQVSAMRAYTLGASSQVAPLSYVSIPLGVVADYFVWDQSFRASSLIGSVLVVVPTIWLLRKPPPALLVRARAVAQAPALAIAADDAGRIERAIEAAENQTSCELRVHVEGHCPGPSPEQRASEVFWELRMAATARRNGILFYLATRDARFAVVADEGVAALVSRRRIDDICAEVNARMTADTAVAGLIHGIELLGRLLPDYFPRMPDDVNELPDSLSIGSL